MCGVETYLDLVDNPLRDYKTVKSLETRLEVRKKEIEKLNKGKKILQKQYWNNNNQLKNQYNQNFRNLKKENKKLLKEVGRFKNKYKSLQAALNDKPNHIPVSKELRFRVFERDNYTCQRCGKQYDLSLDHIKPRLLGGANTLDNLQVLCTACNTQKGASVIDFREVKPLMVREAK